MNNWLFAFICALAAAALIALNPVLTNDYFFSAAYTVLLFVILSTAWNILGGYTGYVNFGTAGFFALGVYTSVALYKAFKAPLPLLIGSWSITFRHNS